MPVVLRVKGYKFWFYEADLDEPPHVHVGMAGKEAKFWLEPITLAKSRRFRKHDLNDIERILSENMDTILNAWFEEQQNVATVKAKIKTWGDDYPRVVPVDVPKLDQVRKFAAKLHAQKKAWRGEAYGWPAEYNPERPGPPLDSKMTFTPADFCIGESGIWFFSLMWEHGRDVEPVEFLDDKNIISYEIPKAPSN